MTMQGDDDLYGALTLLPSAHYHLPEGAISPWSPIGYIDQDSDTDVGRVVHGWQPL